MLERLFHLSQRHTTVKTELLAGLTTFITMAYITFINPSLLALTGMDSGAVFVATCLAAAIGSGLMGLYANYPIAIAPAMGINAYFTYSVVLAHHHPWPIALGAVFISGVAFIVISLLPIREYILNSIPHPLRLAIIAGIGLFLSVIGFKNSGLIVSDPTTLVALGDLHNPTVLLAMLGFFILVGLEALGFSRYAILMSILIVSFLSMWLGYTPFHGFMALPPSLMPTLLKMDVPGAWHLSVASVIIAFLFVNVLDATGTLIGVASQAQLLDAQGKLPRLKRALWSDSSTVAIGAALGTSTTTSYLESITGIKAGGRTGLTTVVVAILFLLMTFFAPLAQSIPLYASAPTLIYLAFLMTRSLTDLNWHDITEYAPAMLTALAIPLTFSIADGICFGFIAYTILKLISGRWRDLNSAMIILSGIFAVKYFYLA